MPASVTINNLELANPIWISAGQWNGPRPKLQVPIIHCRYSDYCHTDCNDLEGCVRHFQGTNVSTEGIPLIYKEASEPSSLPFSFHIPFSWRLLFFVLAWSSLFSLYHLHLQTLGDLVRRFLLVVTYVGLAPAQPVQHS